MRNSWQKEQLQFKINRKTNDTVKDLRSVARKTHLRKTLQDEQDSKFSGQSKKMRDQAMEFLVETAYDIVIVYYIHEHNQIMALSKHTNERFSIIVWNNNDKIVTQRIDLDGNYMQANEIAMCPKKQTFAMCYNDDGIFKLIVFTDSDIKRKIELSKIVQIELVVNNLQTPLINC